MIDIMQGHYAGALMEMPLMSIKECKNMDVEKDGFTGATWRHLIWIDGVFFHILKSIPWLYEHPMRKSISLE